MSALEEHAVQALTHALHGDKDMLGVEVAWLDNGQLKHLITAGERLVTAARAELFGRPSR